MADSIEQTLSSRGFVIHSVSGVSMQPMLDQNADLVKIVPVASPLKVGDIPLFKRPGGDYVLHRVIAVKKKYYRICGDNCDVAEKIPPEWIVGVTEGFFKNGTYIPCTDEDYLNYVKKTCKRLRRTTFLKKFSVRRIINRLKRNNKNGK